MNTDVFKIFIHAQISLTMIYITSLLYSRTKAKEIVALACGSSIYRIQCFE